MNMIDREHKDKDLLALLTYLAEEDRPEKLFENQHLIKIPIVRNGRLFCVCRQELFN